jgi:hypothetical protein
MRTPSGVELRERFAEIEREAARRVVRRHRRRYHAVPRNRTSAPETAG